MATFERRPTGVLNDEVRLELGGEEVLVAKSYEVACGFFTTPRTFQVAVGSASTALSLMKRWPPGTLFRLFIGGVLQFVGRIDGYARAGSSGTELVLSGRDCMARLTDCDIYQERSFTHATYEDLVRYAIEGTGLKRDEYLLTMDAAGQRMAIVGTPITEERKITKTFKLDLNQIRGLSIEPVEGQDLNFSPLDVDPTHTEVVKVVTGFRSDKPIEAKAGQNYYAWVKTELEAAGVFLRGGIDPTGGREHAFLLSAPDGSQPPTYGLVHRRGDERPRNMGTVFEPTYQDLRIERAATYIVLGRSGGGEQGPKQIEGRYTDQEMVDAGYGWKIKVDDKANVVKSRKHAEFLARKNCAAARRSSRRLIYPTRGHTLPLIGEANRRAVVVPDTTILIEDEEFGISGTFWIEDVKYRASNTMGRMMDIALQLPDDLIFGDSGFDNQARGKGKRKVFGKAV